MSINFESNVKLKSIKIYFVDFKKRVVINTTFDKMYVKNKMIRFYREFSRVYMNDIIVFFKILNEHVKHLN